MKIAVYNVHSSASVRLCFTNMGPSIAGTYAVQDVTGVSLTGLRSVRSELIGDGVIKAVSGGRCGIVLDEGLLFRANEDAFVKTKRKLLDDCEVWCIVSLPAGVFTAAEAGVKTNLVFFTKGQPTRKIWYYDLTGVKVRKKTPPAQ